MLNWSEYEEEEKQDCLLFAFRLAGKAIIAGFIIGLAFYTAGLYAQETVIPQHVIDQDSVKMRLLRTPCVDPTSLLMILQMAPPQYQAGWKAITSNWKHKDGTWHEYAGCWYELGEGEDATIFFVFNDGTAGQGLKSELLKPKGSGA